MNGSSNIKFLSSDQAAAAFNYGKIVMGRLKGDETWVRILTAPNWNDPDSEYALLKDIQSAGEKVEKDAITQAMERDHGPYVGGLKG